MEDDSRPRSPMRALRSVFVVLILCALFFFLTGSSAGFVTGADSTGDVGGSASKPWTQYLPPALAAVLAVLVCLSAFFSGSETAFFSIHRLRLRAMTEESGLTGPLVARMMQHPGRLLTTILLGNMIVNVLISVFLGSRVEDLFHDWAGYTPEISYLSALVLSTAALVLFGDVMPKVVAVQVGERFARVTAFPLNLADRILAPLRDGLLRVANLLFTVTRFHELRAAPFITDDELKSLLTDGEAQGVIEEDERQMIQGILEFADALVREILVPRPDIVAIHEDATVAGALALMREHEFSRMPVYQEDLDHISGVLVAKDLLPSASRGQLDTPVKALVRRAHFVPETMTIQQFVNSAQKHRAHLAIVVDEYGGTAGIVTLEDAIEQVVGDLLDEHEQEEEFVVRLDGNTCRVQGRLSLNELNESIGTELEDDEHETIAGLVMSLIDRVPQPGDEVEHEGIRFTVEACDGKRVSTLRITLPETARAKEDKA